MLRAWESLVANKKRRWPIGPGLLVAAAFIGPGTVTAASKAGASFGYALIWAVLFSVVATIVLQEMAVRLGLIAQQGLGEAIRGQFPGAFSRFIACGLVVFAIGFGNSAYQTGNLTGAAQGLDLLTGWEATWWIWLLGLVAFVVLWLGGHGWLERGLIVLVLAMSCVFVAAAALSRPDLVALARGSVVPYVPPGGLATVLALFGTTIVPYNLFLHASAVQKHWRDEPDRELALRQARLDTLLAVSIGGMITVAIIASAAAVFVEPREISGAADMAAQLRPALGSHLAPVLFSLGLFAAGLSSAITAPLAAAYAVTGVLGWSREPSDLKFRAIWLIVLLTGVGFAVSVGKSPVATIIAAQVANAIILPLVAVFLLVIANQSSLLGTHRNRWLSNLLGTAIVTIVVVFAGWKLVGTFHSLFSPVVAPPAVPEAPSAPGDGAN